MENFRRFEATDPFGRNWQVEFRWQQNAISIRRADAVDVKFELTQGEDEVEKVIALPHPALVAAAKKLGRAVTDAWVARLAALHIKEMIATDRDMEKTLVTASVEDIERHGRKLEEPVTVRR